MSMTVPYEETGRRAQKLRTRSALLDAARGLMAEGLTPTIEDAAAEAGISRATAYRYFPNQRALLVAAQPMIGLASLLGDDPPQDPAERFERAVARFVDLTLENEPVLRAMLRLSLEDGEHEELVLRRGRAVTWFNEALQPLRPQIGPRKLRRLVLATRAACGIEALVWLTDVAGLSRDDAARTMRWSARALYNSTFAK